MGATTIANLAVQMSVDSGGFFADMQTAGTRVKTFNSEMEKASGSSGGKAGKGWYSNWLKETNAQFGKRSDFAKTMKLLAGGGAIGGFAMAANEVKTLTDAMVGLKDGTKKWADVFASIPLFGTGVEIGKNIRAMFTVGEESLTGLEARAKSLAAAFKDMHTAAEKMRDTTAKIIEEQRTAGMTPIEKELDAIAKQRQTMEDERKKIEDAAKASGNAFVDLSGIKQIDEANRALDQREKFLKDQQNVQAMTTQIEHQARMKQLEGQAVEAAKLLESVEGIKADFAQRWKGAEINSDEVKAAQRRAEEAAGETVKAQQDADAKRAEEIRKQQEEEQRAARQAGRQAKDIVPKILEMKNPDLMLRGSAAAARVTYQSSGAYQQMRNDIVKSQLAEQKKANTKLDSIEKNTRNQPVIVSI